MKNVIFIFFLLLLCGCDNDNKDEEKKEKLFEEPVMEWGISMDALKSKVQYPVFKEWEENKTISVSFNDVRLIGNKPGYVEYRDVSKDIKGICYYFINDNTTLNTAQCMLSDSIDYLDLVLDLRSKYGVEKSNTAKCINWQTENTYISLSKPDKGAWSLYYMDIDLVNPTPRPVTGVSIVDKKDYTMFIHDLIVLSWQITPSSESNIVDVISSNPSVVEVLEDHGGKILAKSKGNAQIIVRAAGTNIADTCNIIVTGHSGTIFDFENVEMTGKFETFYENNGTGRLFDWASSNPGFALTNTDLTDPSGFPTSSLATGRSGKCLKLETLSTGLWGERAGMPIAAGNLFMGTFDTMNAIKNVLKATKFGIPFENAPTYLTGYYKYKAGDVFSEVGKPVASKKDKCDIYAIFYEVDDKVKTLDGTNAFIHPNLISVARITDQKETDEWIKFNFPFIIKPGKVIDKDKLNSGMYNLAVVFTSSINGDRYRGAVGSTLLVDEVEIIIE